MTSRTTRSRLLVSLAAATSLAVTVAAPVPALADHTAAPTSVTIAGSFQSELGLPRRLAAGVRRAAAGRRGRRRRVDRDVRDPGRRPRVQGRPRRGVDRVPSRERRPAGAGGRHRGDVLLRRGHPRGDPRRRRERGVRPGPARPGPAEPPRGPHRRGLLLRPAGPLPRRRPDEQHRRHRRATGSTTATTRPTRASSTAATSPACWRRWTTSRAWGPPRSGWRRSSRTSRCRARAPTPRPGTTATGRSTTPRSTRTSAPTRSSSSSSTRRTRGT